MRKIEFEIESLEDLESALIDLLNIADEDLDQDDFERLAESTIYYIDEIGRSKR